MGVVKQAFYKAVGRVNVTFPELEKVLLDEEVTVNNCPLANEEDDIKLSI